MSTNSEAAAIEANRQRIELQAAFAPHKDAFQKAERAFTAVPLRKRTRQMCKAFDAACAVYGRELKAYEAACDALGVECFV